jgi:glycosyltransferase involved in cell wall biosynthesis
MSTKKWTHRDVQAPRLRILLDPVYVQVANLGSSSTYQKYVSLTRELVRRGHFVYWMLPDVDYIANPIEDHPNVGVIRTEYIQDQFIVDGLVTDSFFNMFNRIAGKYHIDVVCTSRTGAANMIKRILESPRFHDNGGNYTDKHYGLPMVVIEEFPQTRFRSHVGQAYWLSQCQGYLSSDMTVFISDHNRSEVVEGMVPIYRPNAIQEWVNRCTVIPSGIETAELDTYYQRDRWKHEDGFRVISVGRIMGVSYTQFLEWSKMLYASGMDAKLIVSLSGKLGGPMKKRLSKEGITFTSDKPYYHLIENNPRVAFLKLLRTVHAGIVPMSHLDCPVGVSEALYMGVPLVMPEADYQKTFFPDYPFVVKPSDRNALLGHLQFIKENPDEARDMIEPWRQHLKETFDAPTNISLLVNQLEEVARKPLPKFKTSGAILEFLSELQGERYTFNDVVAYLRKCGLMGISVGDLGIRATWTYGRGTIHHAMRYVGYVDLCDGPEDAFVRRDVFEKLTKADTQPATATRKTRRKAK